MSLCQAEASFIKVLIIHYYNPNCHIYIKTNISDYFISEVFNQLTLNNLG